MRESLGGAGRSIALRAWDGAATIAGPPWPRVSGSKAVQPLRAASLPVAELRAKHRPWVDRWGQGGQPRPPGADCGAA